VLVTWSRGGKGKNSTHPFSKRATNERLEGGISTMKVESEYHRLPALLEAKKERIYNVQPAEARAVLPTTRVRTMCGPRP